MRQQINALSRAFGLGLRRHYLLGIAQTLPREIDCFEIAPENYVGRGGRAFEAFEKIAAHYPILAHGLSLSIGSLDELNWDYLKSLKAFLSRWKIPFFSDHLCFSSYQGHYFHDLLPLPFTWEAVGHVAERARIVQDYLELPFALENISYYFQPVKSEMTELQFLTEVLERARIGLLLDVNNVYVNSVNHGFLAKDFLNGLQGAKIVQIHLAGHLREEDDLIVDNHGAAVAESVWDLFRHLSRMGELPPVILERDHHFPEFSELVSELNRARRAVCR